jgi:Bacterial Ig-like domain
VTAVLAATALGPASALGAGPLSFGQPVKIDQSFGLGGVSCPAESLCVAGDSAGDIVSSTQPTQGASAWTLTSLPPPTSDPSMSPAINGVSCPSVTLCAAVDESGTILTSTNPTAGTSAWSFAPVGNLVFTQFSGLSCPSSSLCVATVPHPRDVAMLIESSTNPTGGVRAWNSAFPLFVLPTGVGCASASLCVAIDAVGDVVPTTNPTGDSTAWVPVNVDGTNALSGISCAPKLCVAVDRVGNVVTSSSPTGGAGAWNVASVDAGHALTAVSCASTSLCVAVDDAGNALVSQDPSHGPTAWHAANVDPGVGLTAVSCASESLCVAVDGAGNVVVGTAAAPQVVSVSPPDGSHRLPADTAPFAVFSEPMDKDATAAAFSLRDDTARRRVAGTVVWFGAEVALFVPARRHLHPRHRYTASVSTAARAADGISLQEAVSWSFAVSQHRHRR